MTRQKKIAWWSGSALIAALVASVMLTSWPTELLQLPLVVNDQPRVVDVVIVLGAGARKNPAVGSGQAFEPLPPQAKERIQRGISLLQQGYAPTMIVAGGKSKQSGYIEADLMKNYAISLGLSADQIVEEDQSINTWQNAVNSLDLMKRNSWQSALVVTSPYHTLRACTVFLKLKGDVRCLAAPLSLIPTNSIYERLTDFRSVVREYGAIIYYLSKDYI